MAASTVAAGRDRQILDAAAELFYENGFHGVGIDDIGDRVGISGPALYRHFRGKDEILASLFNEAMDQLIAFTAVQHDDPHQDLERLIWRHIEYSIQRRHLVNVYQREDRSLVAPWRQHFDRRQLHYASRWEASIARCYPNAGVDQVRCAAHAAIGLMHSIAFWPRQALDTPDLEDLLFRLVTVGLDNLDTQR